jgi:NADPH-dependent 2,4-dienoyl-CoA reductase/sulfur reductase-like enzyme
MHERDVSNEGIVIVGGGLAGQRCAEALRRHGYDGAVRMVCAEAHRPYDRPPLSKELLSGSAADSSVSYRAEEWYEHQSIDLLLGVSATNLDPARRRVALSDGSVLPYGRLLIATGSHPRNLPALERHDNVSTLRTLDDCRRLRTVLRARPRLAVIGGGFIGQEVAATARSLGAQVTMIEAAPCPLAGVVGPRLGEWFARLHRDEGVEVLTSCTVDRAIGNGVVDALCLSNGRVVVTDHILVGVGVQADVRWLAGTGLEETGGVRVDCDGRTTIADVFAAGDAAARFDPVVGRHVSGAHWEAAGRHGARAARSMLGLNPGAATATSFWTDQYGIRIQYLGHAFLADSIELDGNPEARNFTAIFTRAGRAVAALLVDRPGSLPAARDLIEKGMT